MVLGYHIAYCQASHLRRRHAVCTRNFSFYLKLQVGGKHHLGLHQKSNEAHLSQKLHFTCLAVGFKVCALLFKLCLSQKPSEQSQTCRPMSGIC